MTFTCPFENISLSSSENNKNEQEGSGHTASKKKKKEREKEKQAVEPIPSIHHCLCCLDDACFLCGMTHLLAQH